MRGNTIIMILLAVVFGVAAVFLANIWLSGQRSLIARADRGAANTIVVAAKPLRFGETLTSDNLRAIPWSAGALPTGAFRTVKDLLASDAKGQRQVITAMEANEPVLAWKITGPGQRAGLAAVLDKGMKAIAIRVNEVVGVAGFVLPGDRVDILMTRRGGKDGQQAFVDVLLQNIKVLAVDQTADDRRDKPTVARAVTLEVTTADAQKLTLASQVGQLSLALRQAANDKGENTERVTLSDLTGDTPADVARRQSDLDAKLAEAQKRQQEQLSTIRDDVQTVGSRLETRIGSLEERLKNEKKPIDPPPARLEKPHVVVKEVVKYVDPPKPKVVSVGVTRGLKRQVYEVPSVEDGQQIDHTGAVPATEAGEPATN